MTLADDLDDLDDLQKQFLPRPKPPSRRRQARVVVRRRVNQKVQPIHLREMLRLRQEQNLSYEKIGLLLRLEKTTVFQALKRYERRGQVLRDDRANNGQNNTRRKIFPDMAEKLLDRTLLQQWSGLNLQQRCVLIERDFNLKLSLMGLQMFYKRNGVKYLQVSYIYQQGLTRPVSAIEKFAVELAKKTRAGLPLIYFDEASFNLWLRNRRTWTPKDFPIRMVLNKSRGAGITVFGAISVNMNKPLFTLETSTNSKAFYDFLGKLRKRFKNNNHRLTVVLDNARAHIVEFKN